MMVSRLLGLLRRWQSFAATELGARLTPLYAMLLGGALGALLADRIVRSMWRHAIFTGEHQWRTVAVVLAVLWITIGAVAALAVLGTPEDAATVTARIGESGDGAAPAGRDDSAARIEPRGTEDAGVTGIPIPGDA